MAAASSSANLPSSTGVNGINGDGPSRSQLSVLIVGAGLGGLAAAIACGRAGHSVTVLEAAPKLSEVGAGIQCSPNVVKLFKRWGMTDALRRLAVKPERINFRRYANGAVIGKTELLEFERDFGAPYYVVHRAHLLDALLGQALAVGADVKLDKRVSSIVLESETPTITCADGSTYNADLIIGADGIKSVTRGFLLGSDEEGPQTTQFCAYRATVPAEVMRQHPDTAALISAPEINLWVGPERHVMSYLIAGGDTFNLVLSHPAPPAKGPAEVSLEQILREMRDSYAGWDPVLTRVISRITTTMRWPLMIYPSMKRWTNSSKTLALLGDACHGMLPYMSSGAGMAIEDAATLGTLLNRPNGYPSDPMQRRLLISEALDTYEALRIPRATEVQERSELNGRIWHYHDGPAQRARDNGMAATLTKEHYIRSTNQWSDPTTQLWLYGHDAESHARRARAPGGGRRTSILCLGSDGGVNADIADMQSANLLGEVQC